VRWRVAFSYPDPRRKGSTSTVSDFRGRVIWGPVQVAYADHAQTTYTEKLDELQVISGYKGAAASQLPAPTALGSDPLTSLRAMLADGRLEDRGLVTVDGRQVRRLVGFERRQAGDERPLVTRLQYDVDPDTGTPLTARIVFPYSATRQHDEPTPVSVITFERYERLPLDAGTAKLLEVQLDHRQLPTRRIPRPR
jgi:hypothetical protein